MLYFPFVRNKYEIMPTGLQRSGEELRSAPLRSRVQSPVGSKFHPEGFRNFLGLCERYFFLI
jgi:hypothetical protein